VSVRIPIPATPAALLNIAACLDRLWADALASGERKPSLEEEFALCERQSAGPR
jgi:hypothetical protein